MPFLRFTRDKRGYETTALVHSSRQRGRARQRILYWFRTPPGVKVGRPALDEDAIRWIEEHNPDVEFNWPKILEAHPPPPPPAEDARGRRPRREGRERSDRERTDRERGQDRGSRDGRRRQQQQPPRREQTPEPAREREREARDTERGTESGAAAESAPLELAGASTLDAVPGDAPVELAEALEQITHPDTEEMLPPSQVPVEAVDKELLTRMRARYAELQARITERGGEAGRIEDLRQQAEPLNPDTWVTADEVRKGVEEFEPRIRALRAALGLRRRRRSRRGGRRRHRGREAGQANAAPEASHPAEGPYDDAAAAEGATTTGADQDDDDSDGDDGDSEDS